MLEGNVLITGGTGFLARAIYARAEAEQWPATFTCLSRDDSKQVKIQQRWPKVRTIRADVGGDINTLRLAFAGHQTIIHAAAAKYVDRSESAAFDTLRVNAEGSRNVAMAARLAQVERVIGISTDKACQPANVYGMTKAIMERLFLEAAAWDPLTKFSVCRYGNVIGSTGSIVPIFEEQARTRGKITVTEPKMTRFWMPVDEAIDLILYSLDHPGVVCVPMPRSLKIGDIADAIAQSFPERVEIEKIGIRPGEKMHETLLSEEELARTWTLESFGGMHHLNPPGILPHEPVGGQAFTSKVPPGGWMEVDEFIQHAASAGEV
jgi:UDP-N-acetylglucosamine 4,6-dehydratase